METVEAIYKKGVLKPKKALGLKENSEVIVTIEERKKTAAKSLEGIGKQLVSDEELEGFLEEIKTGLSKGRV